MDICIVKLAHGVFNTFSDSIKRLRHHFRSILRS
nr:MAG TPA: hypothetical protein [Caudoviricetes sp.]